MSEAWLYAGLFASSFLAATVIPASSEVVLFGIVTGHPERFLVALTVASVGNTLGSMTSYLLGRVLPQPKSERGLEVVRRYGPVALLLAWVPVIGDSLCVAAGWLRLRPLPVLLFIAIGKVTRYWIIAEAAVRVAR